MKFSIYDIATGQITRQMDCPEDMIDMQVQSGEAYIIDVADDSTHYIMAGAFAPFPSKPSEGHTWNWATKTWEDLRTIEELRETKWSEIKAARTAVFDAPLETPHGIFDSDSESRTFIESTIVLLQTMAARGSAGTVNFILFDNSRVTLNLEQMSTVGLLLGSKIQTAFDVSADLRADIDAATTSEQLEGIVWPSTL